MNDNNEIFEEEPLLITNQAQVDHNAKKTYSLNTGMPWSGQQLSDSSESEKKNMQAKKAMTLGARGMSLATKAQINPIELIEMAKEKCKQPIKLSWNKVSFRAEVKTTAAERAKDPTLKATRQLKIVNSVSGFACPGQATFIMGSSGAGKTSLLNILADRVTSATNTWLEGNITFNDEVPVNKDTFQKYAAYVMQDDVLFATFTVREALRFAAPVTEGAEFVHHKAPISVQMSQLMSRSWMLAKREPRLSRAKLLQTIIVAILMMGAFWQTPDYNSEVSVHDMAGAIYFMTIVQMFLNFQPTVIVFQGEKPIYTRERDSGMYDIWIYATTKLIAEIPIMAVVPFVFIVITYFSVGLTDSFSQFFSFYLVLFMMIQAATAMGYALSSVFNHETTAVAFAPIINMPLNLLGGYMINLKGILKLQPQRGIAWLMYFSPVRYGFTAMMITQFPIKGYSETDKILEQYGMKDAHYWGCIGMLFALFIMFRLLVIVSLALQDRKRSGGGNDTRNSGPLKP